MMDKARDVAAQVQQRVQLDGRLGRTEASPREHRQAQIDRRGIQRIDGLGQIQPEGIVGIQPPCRADQALREVGIDAPIAPRVGIGQRVARDLAANAEMVELGGLRPQARFDVAQALAIGQLRKCHAQILIETGEALDLVLALVARHAATKGMQRQVLHQLREDELACVHRSPRRQPDAQGRQTYKRCSSR